MSSVGIKQSSALSRNPKVMTEKRVRMGNKTVKQKSTLPHYSAVTRDGHRMIQTVSFTPPTNFFNASGNRFVGQVQSGSLSTIHNITLRCTVRVANGDTTYLTPGHFWFNEIRIKAQNGSKLLTTIYPDTLFNALNLVDTNRLPVVKKQAGISPQYARGTPTKSGPYEYTVRIPLIGSIFGYNPLFFANSKSDINFEFISDNPRISPGGTEDPIECLSLDLLVETELLNHQDQIDHHTHHDNVISEYRFLEPISTHVYNKTLSPSTECKIDLDAVTGDVSHLMVLVKDVGASNALGSYAHYNDLEEGATMDIQGSSGKSIFGGGTPVDCEYLVGESFASHFPNTEMPDLENRNVYVIPFCRNVVASHAGVKDGYLQFDGDRKYLTITPGPEFTQQACDIKVYAYIHRRLSASSGRYLTSDE